MAKKVENVKCVSKKEVYAAYGIKFVGGKIESPLGLIPELLIDGNAKIGKGVYHFSTLPTNREYAATVCGIEMTVRGTCVCNCAGCYATTGFYRMQNTIDSLALRTVIARNYMDFCERAIMAQIKADGIQIIRVHASGDFFSVEYADMWRRIAANNPGVTFWTYTKNAACENAFDDIENANIVKSVIPGKGFNFGHCDYVLSCYEFLKNAGKSVYICRCGIDKNQHCTNCHACAKNDYVLFIEHSTDYKAENDPLYPVIKSIIGAQMEVDIKKDED